MAIDSTSSAADLHLEWVRWLVPSVSDVLFMALLGLLVLTPLSMRLLGDAGIGWHIRTGQLILSTHEIPRVDPFSTTAGQPWFAWEWLYDVAAGWLDSAAGLNGVVLFTAVTIAGLFAWTFRLLLRRGANVLVALILVLLAESASMIHCQARPHVVSWLFTVVWFWILESSEKSCDGSHPHRSSSESSGAGTGRTWLLWLLPVLMLAWVNLHGGFLVGFVLLAIYWVGAVWQWFNQKEERFDDVWQKIRIGRRVRDLTRTGVLSAAATFANPYGFKLHVHIYRYLSNRFLMDHIDEFQSPNFHYVAQKCFAGLLLLTLVALAANRRQASASQGLVVLFAVYSGLYASRNIPASSLLLILAIGPWLSDAMERLVEALSRRGGAVRWRRPASAAFLRRMKTMELSLPGHLWPIAAIVLTCWMAAHGGKLGASPMMDAHFDPKRFPVQAVDYLEKDYLEKGYLGKQDVPGPMIGPDYWGGYLIYRLYPRVRMVVDDRHDFYGEEFLKSYLKTMHVEPGWEDFLEQHEAHCVIVPRGSALANILNETPGWKRAYVDEVAVVFLRTPGE
jgi:hypothetical protein